LIAAVNASIKMPSNFGPAIEMSLFMEDRQASPIARLNERKPAISTVPQGPEHPRHIFPPWSHLAGTASSTLLQNKSGMLPKAVLVGAALNAVSMVAAASVLIPSMPVN
jgi:hypothetical protein